MRRGADGQFQQLGQIFGGQLVLLGAALGPGQFIAGVALHQLDQFGLLLPLRHRQLHPAAPPLR